MAPAYVCWWGGRIVIMKINMYGSSRKSTVKFLILKIVFSNFYDKIEPSNFL